MGPPVDLEFVEFLPGEGDSLRWTNMRIRNHSDLAVKDVKAVFEYRNAQGLRIGARTRRHTDVMQDQLVGANTERMIRVQLFNVPRATTSITIRLQDVTFVDGERWVNRGLY